MCLGVSMLLVDTSRPSGITLVTDGGPPGLEIALDLPAPTFQTTSGSLTHLLSRRTLTVIGSQPVVIVWGGGITRRLRHDDWLVEA